MKMGRTTLHAHAGRLAVTLAFALTCAALGLAGCGEPQTGDSGLQAAALTTAPPLLSFGSDWRFTQSAPLVAGAPVRLRYDLARLPRCRAIYHGLPAWDILASWSVDGGPAHSQALTALDGRGQRVGVDITFTVPPGHDLALWFMASDEFGCVEWDSDYGRNFHVPLTPGAPSLHFRWPGWETEVDGALAAGADLWIDYDIRRLPWCRQTYNGLQTWDVRVDYRFDGGSVESAALTALSATGERVAAAARVSAPSGAHALELWFANADRAGCQAWDSRFGANYSFPLQ